MDWNAWFARYAELSLAGDTEALAGLYADGFVVAGPRGAYGSLNDAAFRKWLEGVSEFNRASGMTAMRPLGAVEQGPVGPHHRLVTVRWQARFAATGAAGHEFEVSYVLHQDGPRIVASFSHEDQEERMQAEGLLPAAE